LIPLGIKIEQDCAEARSTVKSSRLLQLTALGGLVTNHGFSLEEVFERSDRMERPLLQKNLNYDNFTPQG